GTGGSKRGDVRVGRDARGSGELGITDPVGDRKPGRAGPSTAVPRVISAVCGQSETAEGEDRRRSENGGAKSSRTGLPVSRTGALGHLSLSREVVGITQV